MRYLIALASLTVGLTIPALSQEVVNPPISKAHQLLECSAFYALGAQAYQQDGVKPKLDFDLLYRSYRAEGERNLLAAGTPESESGVILQVYISIASALTMQDAYAVAPVYLARCPRQRS